MTYIPSSGSSGDLGRYHSSKPSLLQHWSIQKYISFTAGKGWLESRPAPTMGSAVQDPYDWVVHFDNIKKAATGSYPSGYLEAGTYSVNLKYHYQNSVDKVVSHFAFPTFSGASGVNITTNIDDSDPKAYPGGTTSSILFAPTTECTSYEQGGLFHCTLNLKFVFDCDAEVDGIYTQLMKGKNHSSYSASANTAFGWYGLAFAGAETEIVKLA